MRYRNPKHSGQRTACDDPTDETSVPSSSMSPNKTIRCAHRTRHPGRVGSANEIMQSKRNVNSGGGCAHVKNT